MSQELDQMYNAFLSNQLPHNWKSVTCLSLKPLGQLFISYHVFNNCFIKNSVLKRLYLTPLKLALTLKLIKSLSLPLNTSRWEIKEGPQIQLERGRIRKQIRRRIAIFRFLMESWLKMCLKHFIRRDSSRGYCLGLYVLTNWRIKWLRNLKLNVERSIRKNQKIFSRIMRLLRF